VSSILKADLERYQAKAAATSTTNTSVPPSSSSTSSSQVRHPTHPSIHVFMQCGTGWLLM
jgi:hypothetical protein